MLAQNTMHNYCRGNVAPAATPIGSDVFVCSVEVHPERCIGEGEESAERI